ncbi:hypothetical protein Dsin_011091 [Dipteronia sinensis]|uniref:Uncharacterized protein n=1 Tax=Dipteronia sinensis TaxID=43782 RepID=A0AAD9ZI75_9ROSI|nr:hypothetical protein Dsin_033189 [Dipteronia sinensis]KAK3224066.1 hypothetical protein Dsin_011091 [Dipteronia sinensis]
MNRNKWDDTMTAVIPDEDAFYVHCRIFAFKMLASKSSSIFLIIQPRKIGLNILGPQDGSQNDSISGTENFDQQQLRNRLGLFDQQPRKMILFLGVF